MQQIGGAQARQRLLQRRQALDAVRIAGDLGEVGAKLRGYGL